jgi:hypothetical protein
MENLDLFASSEESKKVSEEITPKENAVTKPVILQENVKAIVTRYEEEGKILNRHISPSNYIQLFKDIYAVYPEMKVKDLHSYFERKNIQIRSPRSSGQSTSKVIRPRTHPPEERVMSGKDRAAGEGIKKAEDEE